MSRAQRIAWGLTIALAVYVVPLRIAELAAHRAAHRAAYLAEMSAPASQPNHTHHNKGQEKHDE